MAEHNIDPGPWGIQVNQKGISEIHLKDIEEIDTTGDNSTVKFSNGEVMEIPSTIKDVHVDGVKKIKSAKDPNVVIDGKKSTLEEANRITGIDIGPK